MVVGFPGPVPGKVRVQCVCGLPVPWSLTRILKPFGHRIWGEVSSHETAVFTSLNSSQTVLLLVMGDDDDDDADPNAKQNLCNSNLINQPSDDRGSRDL